MAALQRKLVHKQFNSPMGLYSAQNVKETLNRELKAFGEDGIEVDESLLKPSNLANSAVLRALEEEENEQHGVHKSNHQQQNQETCKNTRESRPRQRIIVDRDTVLKINRRGSRHRSRDQSWPPPQQIHDRSRSASDEHHFDETICHQHKIDSIARKFDHPEDEEKLLPHHKSSVSFTGDINQKINVRRSRTPEWRPTSAPNKVAEITFQVHVGIVEPKKQFFEEISVTSHEAIPPRRENVAESRYQPSKPASHFISRPQTASLDRYSSNKRQKQLPPMKPRSHSSCCSPLPSRLSRNKSPTSGREVKSKSPTDIATTIWPSTLSDRKSVTIKLSPSSHLGGNQINYDPIAMNNNNHQDHNKTFKQPAKPAAPRIIDCSSLTKKKNTNLAQRNTEAAASVALSSSSATKTTLSNTTERNLNNDKQHQKQLQQHQHFHPSTKSYDGNLPTSTTIEGCCTIGSVSSDTTTAAKLNATTTAKPQLNVHLNLESDVKPKSNIDTFTCVRSIDLIDDTIEGSTHPTDEKLRTKQENITAAVTPLARPQQDFNKTVTRNENKFQKDTISNSRIHTINGDKYRRADGKDTTFVAAPLVDCNSNKSPSECKTKYERRKGIYYTDGEYLFGPFATEDNEDKETMTHEQHQKNHQQQQQQHPHRQQRQPKVTVIPIEVEQPTTSPTSVSSSNGIEISNLEQKCGKIQKSITEDLRQIDRYMEQAKMALNRLQTEHKIAMQQHTNDARTPIVIPSKVMITETPLQAMIRRVFHKIPPRTPSPVIFTDFMTSHSITRVENVPVVEQALLDLSNLTAVLASYDGNRVLSPVMLSIPSRQPTPPSVVVDEITDDDAPIEGETPIRSQSSLSESTTATAHSPYTVTDEEAAVESVSNQVQQEKEIVLSKNILAGYLLTKKDQEELLAKATASVSTSRSSHSPCSLKPQSKITDTATISHNELPSLNDNRGYRVENVTGHSCSSLKKNDNAQWQQQQLANSTKPMNPQIEEQPTIGNEHQQNSINNKECSPRRRTPPIGGDAPPPPPPPPPPPTQTIKAPVNNLKYRVNGLYGHNVGLVTPVTANNDADSVVAASSSSSDRLGRARNRKSDEGAIKVRSLSQPPPFEYLTESVPSLQSMTTSTIDLVGDFGDDSHNNDDDNHRRYNNVSPCLYFPGPFHATTGYKRVAWPPVSEGRTVREFTPQPATQPPYPQQQTPQQPNYQRPGASPVPAANQGGHYQPSYPNQQEQQSSPQHPKPQEPYYLQQRSSQAPAAGNANSTVSFRGGIASPVYNTPKPSPQQQYQQHYPPQSQPQSHQQQHLYQTPSAPEPQLQYQPQEQHQYQHPSDNQHQHGGHHQYLDEPNRGRWGHVASPVPQRSGYVQNYQPSQARQASQPPPFESEPQYGFQQQQNHYGASSVPQVKQSYDRQVSGGQPPQQQNNFAPAPYAPATAVPQQYYQAHQQSQPQQYSQTSQPIENHYNYYSQPEAQQQQHQQLQQQQYRGESPGIITLRKEAPITQTPAPVYTSQPAAASYGGGSNMRGDLKWPPPEYKEQAVVENDERRRIAQGPICRPRRINKDYTQFFAKNALSHHYPSYKTPPGTQHIYGSY